MCLSSKEEIKTTCKRLGLTWQDESILNGKGKTEALVLSINGTDELLTVRTDTPGLVNLDFYQIPTAYKEKARRARDKFLAEAKKAKRAKKESELQAASELPAPATTPSS